MNVKELRLIHTIILLIRFNSQYKAMVKTVVNYAG